MPFTLLDRLRQPQALRVEFQPILDLGGGEPQLYALEALTRGPHATSIERPDVLFEYVRRKGQEGVVDMLCIREALAVAAGLPGAPRVSINVHGSTLSQPSFAEEVLGFAAGVGLAPNRLMVEILEHRSQWSLQAFAASLEQLREAGVRIALDDLGVGASNYRLLIDCRPDHLKIDRYLIQGCHRDRYRLAVLESIVNLAGGCAAVPIAEGIEDEADLAVLLELGIRHFQGWLWAAAMGASELATSPWILQANNVTFEEGCR
jgi:EAL domain-containing protein (putative c-di-GMP-specific phosphodiesterase class I)